MSEVVAKPIHTVSVLRLEEVEKRLAELRAGHHGKIKTVATLCERRATVIDDP
jgi:hypothetical protein